MNTRHAIRIMLAVAWWLGAATVFAQSAAEIATATGIRGGLVVQLGCGDGKLLAELGANPSFLVHGLDADAADVAKARRRLLPLGLYGRVSVERWSGPRLPYAENLVNLLIAEDLGTVTMDEVMRVLVPGGVAYVKSGGAWTKTVKPWPEGIDQWTHFLHDASNNAVAADTQVGPPRRLKWTCGPLWTRSHEYTSSLCAMVSGGGRLFYIFDEGLTGVTTPSLPDRWTLVARDAFNGVLLWQRPMLKWGARAWKSRALRSIPVTVPRRLVAQGDRLFVTLGYDAPVSVLDAATGRTLTTYEGTDGTEEIRCLQGVLLLCKRSLVAAIDTGTGRRLWEAPGKVQRLSLAARDGRVYYQDGPWLVCRGLTDGKERWRAPSKRPAALVVVSGGRVLLLDGRELHAVSPETGEELWNVEIGRQRRELFVAQGRLWHWQGENIVGRDPATGKVTARPDTHDVFTPGHHLRCYPSKATENFLITPNRGAEFVSLTGGASTENDWVRGACFYGVMPSDGLLYVPPNPCFCYPGVKLTGFNALAPRRASAPSPPASPSLEKGPAYAQTAIHPSSLTPQPSSSWPTYRHDTRRTGATTCEVPARLAPRWRVRLRGRLTPPVVADDRLLVAARDEHTLYALGADDGRRLWQFTADGRIDSPPTLYGGLVLFGCADGRVYCLRAADGELAWRFRAAPSDRRIIAFSQLESPWRVHGSILVKDGVAYGTAGRSSYLDGGIRVFGLDPATGKLLYETRIDTWARTRKDAVGKPFIPAYFMEGAQSDILVSQGDYIYLGQVKLDRKLARQNVPYVMPGTDDKTVGMNLSGQPYVVPDADPKADYERHQRQWLERTQPKLLESLRRAFGGYSLGQRRLGLHVFCTSGFLDDSWFNRTYWMYAAAWPGYYLAHRAPKTGQLLVVGPQKTYAVQGYPSRNLQSPLFTPGQKGYLLLADGNANEPVLDHRTRGTTKGWGFTRRQPPAWYQWVPVRVRAMVLAGKHLFVAGPPDTVDPADPMAAFEGRKGAVLCAVAAADGKTLARLKLDAPPVFDGLIASSGRLFLCTTDGSVLCLHAPGAGSLSSSVCAPRRPGL